MELLDRLRDSLPTASDGPDHKTWCSVLGTDLREAIETIARLREDFGAVRELVINGGTEAAKRDAEIERLKKPVIPQPDRHGYI